MNEMDIFFKTENNVSLLQPVVESELSSEVNPEKMKEVYENYKFYVAEAQRLYKALNEKTNQAFPSSDKRTVKRFEKFDRLTSMARMGIEKADLSDKEWTVMDLKMEGWSDRKISKVLNCSDTHVRRILTAAIDKICSVLNGN